MVQRSPFVDSINVVTVSIRANIQIPAGSQLQISGLDGAYADSSSAPLSYTAGYLPYSNVTYAPVASNYTVSYNSSSLDCTLSNCSCTDGIPAGPASCGCQCVAVCSSDICSCSLSGSPSGPAQCGCQCVRPSCGSCSCDENGNPSGNPLCQCGCMANATTDAVDYFSNGTTQSFGLFTASALTLTVVKSLYVNTLYSFNFQFHNPSAPQSAPAVYISVNGSITFGLQRIYNQNLTIFGVSNGGNVLEIIQPSFVQALMTQATPVAGVLNSLTLTLQMNCNLPAGSEVTISGLYGASTENSSLAISSSPSHFQQVGVWSRANGTLVMTSAGAYSLTSYTIIFNLTNGGIDQTSPSQYASGYVQLGMYGQSMFDLNKLHESILGVTNGSDPLQLVTPVFSFGYIFQNSPLPSASNSMFVSFETNVNLERGSIITLSNLIYASFDKAFIEIYNSTFQQDFHFVANSTGGYGSVQPGLYNTILLTVETAILSFEQIHFSFDIRNPSISYLDIHSNESACADASSCTCSSLCGCNQYQSFDGLLQFADIFLHNDLICLWKINLPIPGSLNVYVDISFLNLQYSSITLSTPFLIVYQCYDVSCNQAVIVKSIVQLTPHISFSISSPTGFVQIKMPGNFSTTLSLQYNISISWNSTLHPPDIFVEAQGTLNSFPPGAPFFPSVLLNTSNQNALGVRNGSQALYIIVPEFVVRNIGQSNPLAGASNNITLTLSTNCDVPFGSNLTISGLKNTSTPDNSAFQIVGGQSINSLGSWIANTGTVAMSLNNTGLTSYSIYTISFSVQNIDIAQAGQQIFVHGQIESGKYDSYFLIGIPGVGIPSSQYTDLGLMNSSTEPVQGVYQGRSPMYFSGLLADYGRGYSEPCISPFSWPSRVYDGEEVLLDYSKTSSKWFSSLVSQTWPFINQSNNLSLSIVPNCTIANGSWLEFSGFLQTQTLTNLSFPIGGLHAYLFSDGTFPSSARWFQNNGTLKIQCIQDLFANQSYEIHFTVTNPSNGQTSPTISVSGQIAAGAYFSAFQFQNLSAKTSLSSVFSNWFGYSQAYPIERPLEIVEISSSANITQFTPLTFADNVLGVSFVFNLLAYSAQNSLGVWTGSSAYALTVALIKYLFWCRIHKNPKPYISFSAIEQSDPLAGALNKISVNISMSCDLAPGSSLTISGITGSATLTVGSGFELGGPNSSLFVDSQNQIGRAGWDQAPPDIFVSGSVAGEGSSVAPLSQVLMTTSNSSRLGVSQGAGAFRTVLAYFQEAVVVQSSPLANADNTLSVTLRTNCDLQAASTITISGLVNSQSADSACLSLYGPSASLLSNGTQASCGIWNQAQGSLRLTLLNGTLNSESIIFSFSLVNPSSAQAPPDIFVSGSVAGEGSSVAPLSQVLMTTSNSSRLGVSQGAGAFRTVLAYFQEAVVVQSSPLANADNTLSVTLRTNCDLQAASTITISGLVNSQSADSACLSLYGPSASLLSNGTQASCGIWNQAQGSLRLTLLNGTLNSESIIFSFSLVNPSSAQAPPDIFVSGSVAGEGIYVALIKTSLLLPSNFSLSGLNENQAPFFILIVRLKNLSAFQENPFVGRLNTFHFSFEPSLPLLENTSLKITGMNLGSLKSESSSNLTISAFNSTNAVAQVTALYSQADSTISWELVETWYVDLYHFTFQAYNPNSPQQSPNISMCVKNVVFVCYSVTKKLNDVLGVTTGAQPLYVVQPFQVRQIYGSSNLAGGLNNISVMLQTKINFAVQDSIYISGLYGAGIVTTETIPIFDEANSGSTSAFGNSAVYDGTTGTLRLIVNHLMDGNHLYSFYFQLKNPLFLQQTHLTIYAVSSVANVSSLTMSFSNATAPLSVYGIPTFHSLSFGNPRAGAKSNITMEFTVGIEIEYGSYIYFSLPFTANQHVYYPVYIKANANSLNVTEILWISESSKSYLRFELGLNTPFPSSVTQSITLESNFWIPASGIPANNSDFKMFIFSQSTTPFPVSISPFVAPLFEALYVNALSFAVQAYVPQFSENQLTLKSVTEIASTSDEIQLVTEYLACSTAASLQSLAIDSNLSFHLDSSSMLTGNYRLCYRNRFQNSTDLFTDTGLLVYIQGIISSLSFSNSTSFVEAFAPRNSFTVTINSGAVVKVENHFVTLVHANYTCQDTPLLVQGALFPGFSVVSSSLSAYFDWKGCSPQGTPKIFSGACPIEGFYRLCFSSNSISTNETGISVRITQMQLSLKPNSSIISNVDGKFFPQISILVGSSFQSCCFDTLVYVTLIKDGQTDLGTFLYGNYNSNEDVFKTLSCNQICLFPSINVQHTGGNGFQLLFSTPGATVISNEFSIYPKGLAILTAIPSQLIVQSNQTVLLPDPLVVSMQGLQENISSSGSFDGLHLVVKLVTGQNGTDSNSNNSLAEVIYPDDMLPTSARVNGTLIQNGLAIFNGSLSLKIQHQAGKYFRLLFLIREYPNISAFSNSFSIVPAKLGISIGSNFSKIAADSLLSVVKLDGTSNDTFNVNGLPSSLHVSLLDSEDQTIQHASCSACVIARLMKCDNSTPFSTANDFSGSLPQCQISLTDSEPDQVLGAAQAKCATSNSQKNACVSASESSEQFQYTLSNSLGHINGTVSSVSQGIASFYDLQVHFVVGAGYILRFVFSPTTESANSFNVRSSFAAEYGNVLLPDPRFSPNSNFFIRPYKMVMIQQPGGDGVDVGLEGGDGIQGTPDGVGNNHVFRVQPAVAISGDGYLFSVAWNTHGYTPLVAVIKDSSCGGSCSLFGLVLSGNVTPVSTFHSQYRSMPSSQGNRTAYFGGFPAASSTVSFGFNHVWSVTVNDTAFDYNISISAVAFTFVDLKIATMNSMLGVENVQLSFLCGINTEVVSAADNGNGGLFTIVDSTFFDIFSNPYPPTNVKFVNYDSNSFRLEFDPPVILRQNPLSGFIIEVILCNQSQPGLLNLQDFNGSCPKAKDVYSEAFPLATELGTDYFDGGGFSIQVFMSYDNVSIGSRTSIKIDFIPDRSIHPGDKIKIDLGLFGSLNDNVSAQFEVSSEGSGLFVTVFNQTSSTMTLTVPDSLLLVESIPVSLVVPSFAGFVIPDANVSSWYPPRKVVGQVIGSQNSGRFDNCKGNGCVAVSSSFLPILQDSNSMDLTWSGPLQYGGVGTVCSESVDLLGSGQFPTNDICSIFEASAQRIPSGIVGDSGQNGAPVGDYGGSSHTNTIFQTSTADCLSTQRPTKLCALSVGMGPMQTIEIQYQKSSNLSNSSLVELKLVPSVSLGTTDTLKVPLNGLLDGQILLETINFDVYVDDHLVGYWKSSYSSAGELIIKVNDNVFAHQSVVMVTYTSRLISSQSTNISTVLPCYLSFDSNRTTLLFKDGSVASSLTQRYGIPVADYSQSGQLDLQSGKIYKLRVTAFNGRFRSSAVEVDSSARAINIPASPTIFSSVSQDTLNVSVKFSSQIPLQPTQISISFSPSFDLPPASWISLKLNQFKSADGSALSFCNRNDCLHKLYADINYTTFSNEISSAIFNSFSEELILFTNPNFSLLFGSQIQVVISDQSGILYPSFNNLVFDATTSRYLVLASLSSFKLQWVSQFPFADTPRKGFLLQMSSDQYWRYDIQTVSIPDDLSQFPGVGNSLFWLDADLSSTSTMLKTTLNIPALLDRYVRIESEIMRIKNITVEGWVVERGVLNTKAANHSSVLGGGTCSCFTNGTHSGIPGAGYDACVCQAVKLIQILATDFEKPSSGVVIQKGWGSGCDLKSSSLNSWCNPLGKSFTEDIRTYQSAQLLSGFTNLVTFISPCSGSAHYDQCDLGLSACTCQAPFVGSLDYLQLLRKYQDIKINPSGYPLDYPSIQIGNLIFAVSSADQNYIFLNQSVSTYLSYVKIDQEVMLVSSISSSIFNIQIVAPGSGCLQPNGTLVVLNQQSNDFFAQYFTTAGQISSIHIIHPGYNFNTRPDIGTSDPSCSSYALRAVLLNNVLECNRGQLGTVGAVHANGSNVFFVFSVFRQSLQYFFRIAAYNSAGISNYLYFDFQVLSISPTVLSTTGGIMYIEMLGGGFTATGLTIWIGSLATANSIDLSKSKMCNNVVTLDDAGTKVTCTYRPWVGRKHLVIAIYESGMISRISAGKSSISFQAPVITQIVPSYVEPFTSLTLTVIGNSFGPNASDVAGALILNDGSSLPCNPITLVSNSLLYCKVSSSRNVSQDSYVRLTVGSIWSGGGQVTAKSQAAGLAIIGPPSQLTVNLQLDFNASVSKYGLAVLVKQLEVEFAHLVGIPVTRVRVVSIRPGSIIVTYEISWGSPTTTLASPAAVIQQFINILQNQPQAGGSFLNSANSSNIVTSDPTLLNQLSNAAASSQVTTYLQICAISNVILDYQECYLCCISTCPVSPLPVPFKSLNRELKTIWCEQRCFEFCGGFVT
ncbi:hypothetical protein GUITHDRAFT_132974 [Guillardia theta CCMP2712]|uniref:Uncharacterized protein n=2 Tax=Guillardia theta TaxID=55529 RepID=L1JXB5_GUITC|nr:hypothetical protein GUITHDRAFT_132974 [Guillardia theta CCMP2712]EKX53221.1 hypothetical protein GUITHDRAFT_132974 [Guillardia theta CCMP2712]|eukprot:XP_005840201.1 hypothetical protein GUITHDRAFT_132974 [Guillardia theta CCMP2712]